ncbi:GntR family transcriptional regulator [Bacillus sp. FJAT-49705]|uniref:GntR family transcriptional regulator n=1 Tax=Cytobacillus citreus TaxID=2833586 RepID=A0ABS5NXJ2_9BACI|nr:GntR family transcriptional regulator [Cytobacillus citreus]MBS4192565.1 GntR family transcriptional regulator [Cytobacillus citreus]
MCDKAALIDVLTSAIHGGLYKPNDKLPSENELADQFKVPRMVVRKAYEQLQEQGLVYARQGKGSYVQESKLRIPLILTGDVSFTEKMKELQYELITKNVFCEEISYNQKIFQALGIDKHDVVYKIGRLRMLDNCPIAIHISYLPQSIFREIETDGHQITSIFQYYRSSGFEKFTSTESSLSIIFPSVYERNLLNCSSLIPLLQLEAGCIDVKSGKVLEYSRILYRSDRFTYVI